MLLSRVKLDELSYELRHQAATDTSQQRKAEALKRLKVVEAFREANTRVENVRVDDHQDGSCYSA
jgi:DNA-directed RNA polymerase subunit beta'